MSEEGAAVDPFLVKSIEAYNPTEKTELKFKKGQTITVERVNADAATYFGFYGKSEGWFPDYYTTKVKGGKPEVRKQPAKKSAPPKARTPTVTPLPKTSESDRPDNDHGTTPRDGSGHLKVEGGLAAGTAGLLNSGSLSRKESQKAKKEAKLAAKKEAKVKKEQDRAARKSLRGKKGKKGAAAAGADGSAPEGPKGIPPIVEETIQYLETEDRLRLEGIFRVSGSLADVKAIKAAYTKGKKVDLTKIQDPHTVAGVLKIFFRESNNPLLTFEYYDAWISAISDNADKNRVAKIRRVVELLPAQNKLILYRLMKLLFAVSLHADVNLMNVNNIAIVFAPTLLRPPGDRVDLAIQHSSYGNSLIKFMIEHYEEVFGEKPESPPEAKAAPTAAKPDAAEEDRRFSLMLARGSFIGGRPTNDFETPQQEDNEEKKVEVQEVGDKVGDDDDAKKATPGAPEPESTETEDTDTNDKDEEEEEEEPSEEEEDEEEEEPGDTKGGVKVLTMEEMMDKILEGKVNEVDEFLATLDPTIASNKKKELLKKIDDLMASEDLGD